MQNCKYFKKLALLATMTACLAGDTRKRHCPSRNIQKLSWDRILEKVNVVSPVGRTLEEIKRKKNAILPLL